MLLKMWVLTPAPPLRTYSANNNHSRDKDMALTCWNLSGQVCMLWMFQYISVRYEFHLWFLNKSYKDNVSWFCSLVLLKELSRFNKLQAPLNHQHHQWTSAQTSVHLTHAQQRTSRPPSAQPHFHTGQCSASFRHYCTLGKSWVCEGLSGWRTK